MKDVFVLIVDDDVRLRELMSAILQTRGYSVETAENGKQGLKMIEERYSSDLPFFDLLITDIVMPEIDGTEFIRRVRALKSSLRLMAVSGGSRHMSSDLCLKTAGLLGADSVLGKPFDRDQFWNAVDKALGSGDD